MTKVTNISEGPRGIWSHGGKDDDGNVRAGGLVMIDKGKSADVDLMPGEEPGDWFTFDDGNTAASGPLDGSVADLEAHIATLDDPDAIQALIDAETAGKSRKGALAALEARRDELLAA